MAGKPKEETRLEDMNDNDSSAGKSVSFLQWNDGIIKMLRETFNEFHAGRWRIADYSEVLSKTHEPINCNYT